MDKATLARVKELGRSGFSVQSACKCLGISDDTWTAYCKNYTAFSEAWREGRAELYDDWAAAAPKVLDTIKAAALKGDPTALNIFLRFMDGDFQAPTSANAQGPGGPVQVQFFLPDNSRPRYVEARQVQAALPPPPGPGQKKDGSAG